MFVVRVCNIITLYLESTWMGGSDRATRKICKVWKE